MENKAIIPIEEFKELKENNPTEFWKKIWTMVLFDMHNSHILDFIESTSKTNMDLMKNDLKEKGKVHRHQQLYKFEDLKSQFLYDLDFIAQKEEQLNNPPVIVCYLPFPGEGFYIAFININPQKCFTNTNYNDINNIPLELDIYPPHFWVRYAQKAFRNEEAEGKLDNKYVYSKFEDSSFPCKINDKQNEIYEKFSNGFLQKFIGQNKVLSMHHDLVSAMSPKEREENPEYKFSTLLWQGVTFGEYVCEDKVFMHNTFLPYKNLKDDQWNAIRPYIAEHFMFSSKEFPGQFPPFYKFDSKLVEECLIEKLKREDIFEEKKDYCTKVELIAVFIEMFNSDKIRNLSIDSFAENRKILDIIVNIIKYKKLSIDSFIKENRIVRKMLNSIEIWFPFQKTIGNLVSEFLKWIKQQ